MKHPTYCLPIKTPCCKYPVYLVQRGHDGGLVQWTGVPCSCGKTYSFESEGIKVTGSKISLNEYGASLMDKAPVWEQCDDIWPRYETVVCWALPNDVVPPKHLFVNRTGSLLQYATETTYGATPDESLQKDPCCKCDCHQRHRLRRQR